MKKDKKTIATLMIIAVMSFSGVSCVAQSKDPVKAANAINDQKGDANILNADVAAFLVKSADARMMDAKEGKLASQKGTDPAVRKYGRLMIHDQNLMLKKIKLLAAARKISLPTNISKDKQEGNEELAEKTGDDFDKKFIKMMTLDHKRDIKLFKTAADFEDPEVSAFAIKYLTMIQHHLDMINALSVK